MKRHQIRYYARMRDIEVAAFHLNRLELGDQLVSATRVDWYWGFTGRGDDHRSDAPTRRTSKNVRGMLVRAPWMPHVLLPHMVAVVLGVALFIAAVMEVSGLDQLHP